MADQDPTRVRVQLADGTFGTVDQGELGQVQAQGGRIAGSWEKGPPSSLRARAKDLLEGSAAGVAGLARGATMGGSDEQLLGSAGSEGDKGREVVRQKLNELREKHPYMSAFGEIAGSILPGIETGGVATEMRAARVLPEVLPGITRAAEEEAPTLVKYAPSIAKVFGHAVEDEAPRVLDNEATSVFRRGAQAASHEGPIDLGEFKTLEKGDFERMNGEAPEWMQARRPQPPTPEQMELTNPGGRPRATPEPTPAQMDATNPGGRPQALVRRAASIVDRNIGRGVARFFGEDSADMRFKEKVLDGDHDARVAAVAKAITSGEFANAVQSAVDPIMEHAPKTSGSFMNASLRVTQYLAAKLPQHSPGPSPTPHLDSLDWNDFEKDDFGRAVDIAHDPVSILADLENGSITPDQVDAIKNMYPSIYADIADEISNGLAARREPLDYDKLVALSIFLGQPMDPTMEPTFIASMQATFPSEHGLAPTAKPGKRTKRPKKSDLEFVGNARLEGLNDEVGDSL